MEDENASSLSPSSIDDDESQKEVEVPKPRGRPVGKPDTTQRYRRTAQEISDDKIKVVQMKLDAMKEAEALKMANKKSRRPSAVSVIKRSGVSETVSLIDRIDEEPLLNQRDKTQSSNQRPESSNQRHQRQESSSPSSGGRTPRRPAHRRQSLYDSWFPPSPRTMR